MKTAIGRNSLINVVALSAVVISGIVAVPREAIAEASYHDVVIDERGNIVHDKRGGCVFTKWLVQHDKCSVKQQAKKPEKHTYTRPYLVFFDFDKSVVTAEADEILSALYGEAKKAVRAWYHITGHADRSGTDAYNMALSKRRAQAVKSRLLRMGVAAKYISISYKGEREPLVQTPDGVREPQNRRAEIRLTVERIR